MHYIELLVAGTVVALTLFVWNVFLYPLYFSPLRNLPQPGNKHWFMGHGRDYKTQSIGFLARDWYVLRTLFSDVSFCLLTFVFRNTKVKNNGLIRILWLFNRELVLVTSREALAEVLVTNSYTFEKPLFVRNNLASAVGWSVLTAEGEEHKKQRQKLTPAFAYRNIRNLYPTFWAKSCQTTSEMLRGCDKDGVAEVDVSSWASRCTLDIIGCAVFGKDFGAIADDNNPLVKTYNGFKASADDIVVLCLRMLLPEMVVATLPLPRLKRIRKASMELRQFCQQLVRERKQEQDKKVEGRSDLLSVALSSHVFTESSLVDQMMTFLSAGHDTTAAALTWAIYILCRFPKIQERLRSEVQAKLHLLHGSNEIDPAEIDGLPYLNAVCSEVLRTHSPVPYTLRQSKKDTTIQGQYIPSGTNIVVAPWATNVDQNFWGLDAGDFNPERWLKSENVGMKPDNAISHGGATSNYGFMTFLQGPRSCIGASFAKAEFACILAAWVGQFSFKLMHREDMDESNLKVYPSAIARPGGGLYVRIKANGG